MSTKTKPDATLAVATISTDTPITSVVALLEEKLSKLKSIETSSFKAGTNLDAFGNIQSITDIKTLIKAFSYVTKKKAAYDEAAEALGMDNYPVFDQDGYSAEAWQEDIKLRIAIINHKETYDTLKGLKEQASKFLTESDQKAILFEKIVGFVGKL